MDDNTDAGTLAHEEFRRLLSRFEALDQIASPHYRAAELEAIISEATYRPRHEALPPELSRAYAELESRARERIEREGLIPDDQAE